MKLIVIAIAIAMAGCTASYNVNPLSGSNSPRLDRAKPVYIAVPQDGTYGGRMYSGSGQSVAQAVAAAFSSHAHRVQIADRRSESEEAAVAAAKALGAGYVAVPIIAHWEQRNTAWSGLPSRMSIRLTVFDAETGKQLASSAIEGTTGIVSMTATYPETLLREPVTQYVRGLY